MKRSETVETGRCAHCRIFTALTDLTRGPDGRLYCCGMPSEGYRARVTPDVGPGWDEVPPRTRLARATRLVVGVMLALTVAFPLAACASQL